MLTPNTLLQNRYLILRLLAEGGMGAVYESKDQRLGNTVALKETYFTDEQMRRAFHREAAMLATLRHHSLPKVIDHFAEGEGQFLVMEYIRGDDLSKVLSMSGGPIPPRDALAWADQLLATLEYLHSQRPAIIHRDIKPQNLKLNERGEVILLDFGLAKEAAGTGTFNRSVSPSVRGYTLIYAPLEQIQGIGTDPRSDLYSVAATIYHLITNVPPADAVLRASAYIEGKPDPLRPAHELNPRVSTAISEVLAVALSQDRARRQPNAKVLREQLRQAIASGDQPTVRQAVAPPTTPMTAPPVFHAQPKQAVPLAPRIKDVRPTDRTPPAPTAPVTAAPDPLQTVSIPVDPIPAFQIAPDPPYLPVESGRKSQTKLFLAVAAMAVAAILLLTILFLPLLRSKRNGTDTTGGTSTAGAGTTAIAGEGITPIASREIIAGGDPESRLYSFVAKPGELKITLNVLGNGSTVDVNVLDEQKKKLRLLGDRVSLSVGSTGSIEQTEGRLIVDREKPLLLEVKIAYPDSLQAYRLKIDGPTNLADGASSSPLASVFEPRDRPKPLAYNAVYGGQGSPADQYYTLIAGPGELKATLDVLGNGSTTDVELFNEKSRKLDFAPPSGGLSVGSTGQIEERVARLTLPAREKLLVRIRTTYPNSLTAYRLKLEGQMEGVNVGSDPASQALAALFSTRDNPLPLNSWELSSQTLDRDYYYWMRVGPGSVTFDLELTARGSTFKVELFKPDATPVKFTNGSDEFSISSTGEKQRGKAELALGSEEKLIMRLNATYPADMSKYRLKIEGAVKKAIGE
jgi:serine/threonine protein kinase